MGHPDTTGGKSEALIQREICEWLAEKRYFFWRNNNIPVYGRALPKYTPKGLPDIFVIHRGRVYGFEVKRPRIDGAREKNGRLIREGKLSVHQANFGVRMMENGGYYSCVRSLDDVKGVLLEGEIADLTPQ